MKTRIAGVAVALVLSASAMQAQSGTDWSQLRFGIPPSDSELTLGVDGLIRRGDAEHRAVDARSQYRAAVNLARRQGHLPSLSMWRLANSYFSDGDLGSAGDVMDQLAQEAAERGDLGTQALALYFSAWINGQAGRAPQFNTRIERLQTLLKSQYMPVAVRTTIGDWLNAPSTVAGKP